MDALDPRTWRPGLVLIHKDGGTAILKVRKADNSGWWIEGGGGLSDVVSTSDYWMPLTPGIVRSIFIAPGPPQRSEVDPTEVPS